MEDISIANNISDSSTNNEYDNDLPDLVPVDTSTTAVVVYNNEVNMKSGVLLLTEKKNGIAAINMSILLSLLKVIGTSEFNNDHTDMDYIQLVSGLLAVIYQCLITKKWSEDKIVRLFELLKFSYENLFRINNNKMVQKCDYSSVLLIPEDHNNTILFAILNDFKNIIYQSDEFVFGFFNAIVSIINKCFFFVSLSSHRERIIHLVFSQYELLVKKFITSPLDQKELAIDTNFQLHTASTYTVVADTTPALTADSVDIPVVNRVVNNNINNSNKRKQNNNIGNNNNNSNINKSSKAESSILDDEHVYLFIFNHFITTIGNHSDIVLNLHVKEMTEALKEFIHAAVQVLPVANDIQRYQLKLFTRISLSRLYITHRLDTVPFFIELRKFIDVDIKDNTLVDYILGVFLHIMINQPSIFCDEISLPVFTKQGPSNIQEDGILCSYIAISESTNSTTSSSLPSFRFPDTKMNNFGFLVGHCKGCEIRLPKSRGTGISAFHALVLCYPKYNVKQIFNLSDDASYYHQLSIQYFHYSCAPIANGASVQSHRCIQLPLLTDVALVFSPVVSSSSADPATLHSLCKDVHRSFRVNISFNVVQQNNHSSSSSTVKMYTHQEAPKGVTSYVDKVFCDMDGYNIPVYSKKSNLVHVQSITGRVHLVSIQSNKFIVKSCFSSDVEQQHGGLSISKVQEIMKYYPSREINILEPHKNVVKTYGYVLPESKEGEVCYINEKGLEAVRNSDMFCRGTVYYSMAVQSAGRYTEEIKISNVFVLMEYIPKAQPLLSLIHENKTWYHSKVSVEDKVHLCLQLCEALAHLHQQKVECGAHNMSNILVTEDMQLKVIPNFHWVEDQNEQTQLFFIDETAKWAASMSSATKSLPVNSDPVVMCHLFNFIMQAKYDPIDMNQVVFGYKNLHNSVSLDHLTSKYIFALDQIHSIIRHILSGNISLYPSTSTLSSIYTPGIHLTDSFDWSEIQVKIKCVLQSLNHWDSSMEKLTETRIQRITDTQLVKTEIDVRGYFKLIRQINLSIANSPVPVPFLYENHMKNKDIIRDYTHHTQEDYPRLVITEESLTLSTLSPVRVIDTKHVFQPVYDTSNSPIHHTIQKPDTDQLFTLWKLSTCIFQPWIDMKMIYWILATLQKMPPHPNIASFYALGMPLDSVVTDSDDDDHRDHDDLEASVERLMDRHTSTISSTSSSSSSSSVLVGESSDPSSGLYPGSNIRMKDVALITDKLYDVRLDHFLEKSGTLEDCDFLCILEKCVSVFFHLDKWLIPCSALESPSQWFIDPFSLEVNTLAHLNLIHAFIPRYNSPPVVTDFNTDHTKRTNHTSLSTFLLSCKTLYTKAKNEVVTSYIDTLEDRLEEYKFRTNRYPYTGDETRQEIFRIYCIIMELKTTTELRLHGIVHEPAVKLACTKFISVTHDWFNELLSIMIHQGVYGEWTTTIKQKVEFLMGYMNAAPHVYDTLRSVLIDSVARKMEIHGIFPYYRQAGSGHLCINQRRESFRYNCLGQMYICMLIGSSPNCDVIIPELPSPVCGILFFHVWSGQLVFLNFGEEKSFGGFEGGTATSVINTCSSIMFYSQVYDPSLPSSSSGTVVAPAIVSNPGTTNNPRPQSSCRLFDHALIKYNEPCILTMYGHSFQVVRQK